MTTDSEQLPPIYVIERAVKAVQEATREKNHTRHILAVAVTLIAVGAIVAIGANITVTVIPSGDPEGSLGWVHAWKETAHAVGVAGVVLLAVSILMAANRRRHDIVIARLNRLERLERERHDMSDEARYAVGYADGIEHATRNSPSQPLRIVRPPEAKS